MRRGSPQLDVPRKSMPLLTRGIEPTEAIYGVQEAVPAQEEPAGSKYGLAKHIRDALPFATFVGSPAPLSKRTTKDTRQCLRRLCEHLRHQDAVLDQSTVPIYYESRLAKIDINSAEIETLKQERRRGLRRRRGPGVPERRLITMAALEKLVGAKPRLDEIARGLDPSLRRPAGGD